MARGLGRREGDDVEAAEQRRLKAYRDGNALHPLPLEGMMPLRGRGTAADPQDVEIMLADIGFERMDELLWQAEQAVETIPQGDED